ncbi:hypothetical protein [Heyndrickxia ginsengihumi]
MIVGGIIGTILSDYCSLEKNIHKTSKVKKNVKQIGDLADLKISRIRM